MKYFERFVNENSVLVGNMKHCAHGHLQHVEDDEPGDSFVHVINPFHMEDSVWTHTMMVMNEMKNNGAYSDVTEIITMLHDIGKCDVRDVKTKDNGDVRVRFFGHAGFSFYRAIDVMKDWDLPTEAKIHILSAISLHGEFYDYFRDDKVTDKMWLKLADRFEYNEMLFTDTMEQVAADCNGRIARDDDGYVDVGYVLNNVPVDDLCVELPEYEGQPVVTMLVGPPACGKSTWVEDNKYDHYILSRDAIVMEEAGDVDYTTAFATVDQNKVDKLHQQALRHLTSFDTTFVVDQTNMSRKSRRKILSQVSDKYWKKAVVFATGYNDIMERRAAREGKEIPNYVMKNMIGSFMVPLYDEFDEIEWVF